MALPMPRLFFMPLCSLLVYLSVTFHTRAALTQLRTDILGCMSNEGHLKVMYNTGAVSCYGGHYLLFYQFYNKG